MRRGFPNAAPWEAKEAASIVFHPTPVSHLLSWPCHWNLWAPLQLLLAGSPKGLVKADFLNNPSLPRSKTITWPNKDLLQHFRHVWCLSQSTSQLPCGPTGSCSCSHPAGGQQAPHVPVAAWLPGGRDAACPHLPWSRSSALPACWSYCLLDKRLEENGEPGFFSQGFWRMSCIFLSNMHLSGWQPCQTGAARFC